MKCHDKLSGERFEITGTNPQAEIEQWVLDGIDSDTGPTGYDVETDSGECYEGIVDPSV